MDSPAASRLSGFRLFLLASAVYLACMTPFFLAYLPHLSTALIGPPVDNMNDFWGTWYSQKTWDAGGRGFFHTNLVRYPEGVPLYYHSFAFSDLLAIFFIRKLFHLSEDPHVLAVLHNAALLASFYFSALGAFYLARRFTRHVVSALFAGYIFAFSPFHLAHFLNHMNVSTIEFIPFFVLCFLKAADTGRPLPLVGAIVFYFLNAISSWYYFVFASYFLAFYYAYEAIRQRKLILPRLLRTLLITLGAVLLMISPILVPMLFLGWRNPEVRSFGGRYFVADLLGYLVFPPYHSLAWIGQPVFKHFTGDYIEMTVYLGIFNLALFFWTLWNRKRLELPGMTFLLSGMLVFMTIASGPYLRVLGKAVLPLPAWVLEHLPFFSNVEAKSRAIAYAYLFFGVALGLGVDAILRLCRERGRPPALLLAPFFLLVFLDFYPRGLVSTPVAAPRAYSILAQDPDTDFGVLDLPRGYLQSNAYMMYQAFHHRPIVDATLSRPTAKTLYAVMENEDMALQKRQLTKKKVKYIFIHQDWMSAQQPGEQIDVPAYGRTYQPVYLDDNCVVLRVY